MQAHPILPDSQRIRAIALGMTFATDDGPAAASPVAGADSTDMDASFHFGAAVGGMTLTSGGGSAVPPPVSLPIPPAPLTPPHPSANAAASASDLALLQPAYGPDPDATLKREVRSYQWGRDTYHAFLDRLRAIDASIEHPLAIEEMRAYVMRMAIAYSGHPDARIAVKALDMLARMKPVGLYEEKRHRDPNEMTPVQIADEIKTLLRSMR